MRHKGMTFCKLLGLLVLALLLTGCAQQPQAPFDGVIATSDVVFNLDFTALNTTYTSTLIVPEDKEIMADIQCDGGRIDVTITPEDGEPIYTGKRLPTSSLATACTWSGMLPNASAATTRSLPTRVLC